MNGSHAVNFELPSPITYAKTGGFTLPRPGAPLLQSAAPKRRRKMDDPVPVNLGDLVGALNTHRNRVHVDQSRQIRNQREKSGVLGRRQRRRAREFRHRMGFHMHKQPRSTYGTYEDLDATPVALSEAQRHRVQVNNDALARAGLSRTEALDAKLDAHRAADEQNVQIHGVRMTTRLHLRVSYDGRVLGLKFLGVMRELLTLQSLARTRGVSFVHACQLDSVLARRAREMIAARGLCEDFDLQMFADVVEGRISSLTCPVLPVSDGHAKFRRCATSDGVSPLQVNRCGMFTMSGDDACTCAELNSVVLCNVLSHNHSEAPRKAWLLCPPSADNYRDRLVKGELCQNVVASNVLGPNTLMRWQSLLQCVCAFDSSTCAPDLFNSLIGTLRLYEDAKVAKCADCLLAFVCDGIEEVRAGKPIDRELDLLPRTSAHLKQITGTEGFTVRHARYFDHFHPKHQRPSSSHLIQVTLAIQLFIISRRTRVWNAVWREWVRIIIGHAKMCTECYTSLVCAIARLTVALVLSPCPLHNNICVALEHLFAKLK